MMDECDRGHRLDANDLGFPPLACWIVVLIFFILYLIPMFPLIPVVPLLPFIPWYSIDFKHERKKGRKKKAGCALIQSILLPLTTVGMCLPSCINTRSWKLGLILRIIGGLIL